jgi:hypothetical protein
MMIHDPVFRYGAAGVAALAALVCAGGAAAGMFTTADSIADFNIDWAEDKIIYAAPRLDQVELRISGIDNTVVLASVDRAVAKLWSEDSDTDWTARLTLSGARAGSQPTAYKGSYTTFGTLQEFDSTLDGVEMTLNAMESAGGDPTPAGHPTWLGFLLSGPSTGSDANDLLAYGVYVYVAGLTEEYWSELQQSGSIPNLPEFATTQARTANDAEMPTPATPLLLLAGMVGWRILHRRSQAQQNPQPHPSCG